MSSLMDTLATNSRIQNLGHVPKGPPIDRTHYGDLSSHGYYSHPSSYNSKGTSAKKSIALTALTLLAFMFFLNILQNCLQDQILNQNPQVMVLSSRLKQSKEADNRKDDTTQDQTSLNIEGTNDDEDKNYLQIAKRILDTKV